MNNLTLIRWAGGKAGQLADLLPLIPISSLYVEPFGGGGSVLLNRPRSKIEVYNDLDSGVVNLFRVVRDSYDDLITYLELVPYSRETYEWGLTWELEDSDLLRAVAFYTMMNQTLGGKRATNKGSWARSRTENLAMRWADRLDGLQEIHRRLRGVQIEHRDGIDVLRQWDTKETVFYCDPPYVLETRGKNRYYAVEPGDQWHELLVDVLLELKGAVVLSGYRGPIYQRLEDAGWKVDQYTDTVLAAKTRKRTEVVYRNEKAAAEGIRVPLFK